jgi:hypothetical protein
MEKVRECGLMFSREETQQERKDVGEDEWVEPNREFWRVVARSADAMMKGLQDKDTPRRRRAAARHDNLDLEFPLGRI